MGLRTSTTLFLGLRTSTTLLLFVIISCLCGGTCATTDPQDAVALLSLMNEWQNTPPSWTQGNDPCTTWEGVICSGSRVTGLNLASMGLKGTLTGDISRITQLQTINLSFNKGLTGNIPRSLGNLKQLTSLSLSGCGLDGQIPQELGNLSQLYFLALNTNQFSGPIPASLGRLSKLFWFDVSENQLTGSIPISTSKLPGLDLLVNTSHFHFNQNNLSGEIPENLFSAQMTLIHILFESNQFTGQIPASVGLVESLEVLRLDNNLLTGPVPSSINNLTNIHELNLANNQLNGSMPDLNGMRSLNYVDMSNNTFDATDVPPWFSTLQSLNTLVIESGSLHGELPKELFSIPGLEQVILDNNKINGTLDMGNSISQQLQTVNLQNNNIAQFTVNNADATILLVGNPVCNGPLGNSIYCLLQQPPPPTPYSTSLAKCGSISCPSDQSINPQNCLCAHPYEGQFTFRAPFFRDVTTNTTYQELEKSLWTGLSLTPNSVYLSNPFYNTDNYLMVHLKLFPSDGVYFNRSEIQRIANALSSQKYKPPKKFGPYIFTPFPYIFLGEGKSSISKGVVAGIAVGCSCLIIGLIAVGFYAYRQKKRAEKAMQLSKPFASWGAQAPDNGEAPQLKGARWFSFDEIKKITNNFSGSNELGSGGYGKVYKGTLTNGQMVAIKRAQQGSLQGAAEFKTEIELLSRVHHKNLVDLVGFCFDQAEQMLVYEFVPNGTLRDCLTGKGGIQLDWKMRLRTALTSARGLAYLHELANPPIIHRDVKSTNILMDEHFNAKVADFGLSKLVSDNEKGHVSTQVKGTLGYLDPEYYMTQQLSEKSDVYSFGVVMLELISAKLPIEKSKYIVREVRLAMDMNDDEYLGLKELIDPVIRNSKDLIYFRRFTELAMRCVEESAANRPTMNGVVKEIEMMLQEDGVSANYGSSSDPDIRNKSGGIHNFYNHPLPGKKDLSSDAFDYSGGYSFMPTLEPK